MAEPFWRRYLRLIKPDPASDVEDELRFHLDSRARDFEARGLDADAARRAAAQRFGDVDRVRAWLRHHDSRRLVAVGRTERRRLVVHHLRFAARGLRKQPTFALAAILTLALGIGASSAIVAVVDAVLLSPLPYRESDRLVTVWHRGSGGADELATSQALYATYLEFGTVLTGLGAHVETAANLTEGTTSIRVEADSASASLFSVLGISPIAGRGFGPEDERPDGPPVVLISERLWRQRLGRSPDVIGQTLRIDDVAHQVIGVLPARQAFPSDQTDLWFPLRFDPAPPVAIAFRYYAVGRLRPGVTVEQAETELQRVLPRVGELFANAAPGFPMKAWLARAGVKVSVHRLRDDVVGDVGRMLWVITATIGFVLLAACANIANLFLTRSESRQRELAIHVALGADRRDSAARFLAEAALLAAIGAGLGTVAAMVGLSWLKRTEALAIPRLAEIDFGGRALAITIALTGLVALGTALLPILKVGAGNVAALLRSGSRGTGDGRDGRRIQRSLVVTQVALAYVLLAACALLGRTFRELRQVRLGFEPDSALGFRLGLPQASYGDLASVTGFYAQLEEKLAALPGVTRVGFTTDLPLEPGRRNSSTVLAEGDVQPEEQATKPRTTLLVSEGYFGSLGVAVVAGRPLAGVVEDPDGREAMVNLAFARTVWGDQTGQAALGKELRFMATAPPIRIVGVAADHREAAVERSAEPTIFLGLNTAAWRGGNVFVPRSIGVVIRTSGDPAALAAAVRQEVMALDPGLPIYRVAPLRTLVESATARTSVTALLLGIAALVALVLGAVGLFGIVSYMVGRRRREIGLRVALGAKPSTVVRRFTLAGARLALLGVSIGVVGAAVVTRGLGALLYGVAPMDPASLIGVGAVLLGVATVASWIPASRAGRVDPASVLASD
jgi:predicted permease